MKIKRDDVQISNIVKKGEEVIRFVCGQSSAGRHGNDNSVDLF